MTDQIKQNSWLGHVISKIIILRKLYESVYLIHSSHTALKESAQLPVRLIPITLEMEIDGLKIKDSFTWNLNGKNNIIF